MAREVNPSQIILNDWLEPSSGGRGITATDAMMAEGESRWWGGGISGVYGATPTAGIPLSEGRALTSVTAYACSRARAETLASLPPVVYQQVDEFTRSRSRRTDPWYLLHDEPNPHMDSMTFYELMNMRMVNRGNAFAEIERNGDDSPRHLWPIHPSRVRPVREGNDIVWQVYTDVKDPLDGGFKFYVVPDRDMLNICNFGGNGVLAPGVIDMGREEIGLDIAAQQYGSSFFGSGARPAGVVEHPGYIDDDDQRREFRTDMNRIHSGRENWNKIAIMWQGAKYKEIQANPEQAQFLETRGYEARQLCRLWNVPPAIVQIFDDYKFNTPDAMIMQFILTCVRADAVRFERAINRKVMCHRDSRGRLVDAFDGEFFLEFLLEGLLRGDAKKSAETMEIKRRNGIVNANEWRNKDNENPLKGEQGEKYVLPGGFADLATIGQVPATVRPANSAGGSDNASALSQDGLPQFSRKSLMDVILRNLKPHRNQARGFTLPKGRKSSKSQFTEMAAEVLREAVSRIEAVLSKELDRLIAKQCLPTDATWEKHASRLQAAVEPACKIYVRRYGLTSEAAAMRATRLAMHLANQLTADVKLFGVGTAIKRDLAKCLRAAAMEMKTHAMSKPKDE